ncbi:MAG: hypothetical protein ABIJ57_16420 [Pseudomonadota bacterium]
MRTRRVTSPPAPPGPPSAASQGTVARKFREELFVRFDGRLDVPLHLFLMERCPEKDVRGLGFLGGRVRRH